MEAAPPLRVFDCWSVFYCKLLEILEIRVCASLSSVDCQELRELLLSALFELSALLELPVEE